MKTWNILKYVDFCGKAPLTLKVNCLCFQFVSYFFQLVSMFADKLEPSMQTMGDSINLLATKAIAKKLLVWHLFATEFTLFASTSNSRSSKLQNSSQCFISMEYPCTVLFMIYSGDWILVIKILLEIMTPYAFVYTDLHFFYRAYFSNSAAVFWTADPSRRDLRPSKQSSLNILIFCYGKLCYRFNPFT